MPEFSGRFRPGVPRDYEDWPWQFDGVVTSHASWNRDAVLCKDGVWRLGPGGLIRVGGGQRTAKTLEVGPGLRLRVREDRVWIGLNDAVGRIDLPQSVTGDRYWLGRARVAGPGGLEVGPLGGTTWSLGQDGVGNPAITYSDGRRVIIENDGSGPVTGHVRLPRRRNGRVMLEGHWEQSLGRMGWNYPNRGANTRTQGGSVNFSDVEGTITSDDGSWGVANRFTTGTALDNRAGLRDSGGYVRREHGPVSTHAFMVGTLEGTAYAVGDSSAKTVGGMSVSTHHALLVRDPVTWPDGAWRFRTGDGTGNTSVQETGLASEDLVDLVTVVRMEYYVDRVDCWVNGKLVATSTQRLPGPTAWLHSQVYIANRDSGGTSKWMRYLGYVLVIPWGVY